MPYSITYLAIGRCFGKYIRNIPSNLKKIRFFSYNKNFRNRQKNYGNIQSLEKLKNKKINALYN